MKRVDILYEVQRKLIADLGLIVQEVRKNYQDRLNNAWVFDHLGGLIKKLQPTRVETINYSRKDLETTLSGAIEERIGTIQKHVPEIRTSDVHQLIQRAGNLYELIYSRAEAELSSLESKSDQYNDPKELVQSEFYNNQAFSKKDEHQTWVQDVTENLGAILNYVEVLGQQLAMKKGFGWKAKLAAAKVALSGKLGISLDLPKLAQDISIAKEAILTNYQQYETRLIKGRYT
ncbi:hypothetical protein CEE44_01065 [Candidatus Woesearchaeota archaeon B3_Woes]|nr:MAG: hypothetical protein CEE44_01065 [Candidatus Woesearchaeota archaeon B3_Woes]